MAAINDITGKEITTSAVNSEEYDKGYEKIFGKDRKPQRGSFIFDEELMKMVSKDEYYARKYQDVKSSFTIIEEIKPYQSMIDGSMITGRRDHREHLKRNNCIEAGDMPIKNPERPKDNLKEQIARQVYEKLRYK